MQRTNRKLRSSINVWALAQHYVDDNRPYLGSYYPTISGWIRSRALHKVATCSTLVNLHCAVMEDVPLVRTLLQIEAFFKKNQSLACRDTTESAALESFLRAETLCRITNKRLDYYLSLQPGRLDPALKQQIDRAAAFVGRICGNYRDFLDSVPRLVRFSGGATATRRRVWSHPTRKLRRNGISTVGCFPLCSALYEYAGLPGQYKGKVVSWNRVLWVPKNFKTARTIACEPDGNIPFQLALDQWLKLRLRMFGQDLGNQVRNQRDAYRGSVDGSIATIDFSMASDTVSLNAVHALFPSDFVSYLRRVRSPLGLLPDGRTVKYAKLSSMGNGATFTVETVIFFALAHAVGSKIANVYGDDVTIEAHLASDFMRLARFLGFIPNTDKSFSSGFFRESCGKHYLCGKDVTPHYLRSNILRQANIALLCNGLATRDTPIRALRYALSLARDRGVPIVPINEDPTTGVFVSVTYARQKRLLRSTTKSSKTFGPYILTFRGLTRRDSRRDSKQHAAYWLWHLSRYRNPWSDTEDSVELSKLTLALSSYRTRELCWREPAGGLPDLTVVEILLNRG